MSAINEAASALRALSRHRKARALALENIVENFHTRWDRRQAAILDKLSPAARALVEAEMVAEAAE
jgi:hypothetical protein